MRINGVGTGLTISGLLFIPVGLLDLVVAFNYYIGNWAMSSLILPYLVYFGIAVILRWKGYTRLGKGLAIGGVVLSTLIIIGTIFFALMFGASTEFG
jgi:hypothetical protein